MKVYKITEDKREELCMAGIVICTSVINGDEFDVIYDGEVAEKYNFTEVEDEFTQE